MNVRAEVRHVLTDSFSGGLASNLERGIVSDQAFFYAHAEIILEKTDVKVCVGFAKARICERLVWVRKWYLFHHFRTCEHLRIRMPESTNSQVSTLSLDACYLLE